jgi:hypothetical protein
MVSPVLNPPPLIAILLPDKWGQRTVHGIIKVSREYLIERVDLEKESPGCGQPERPGLACACRLD